MGKRIMVLKSNKGIEYEARGNIKPQSICWNCKNAYADRCDRFNMFKEQPLDFWIEYIEDLILMVQLKDRYFKNSFIVLDCKNYEFDDNKPRGPR